MPPYNQLTPLCWTISLTSNLLSGDINSFDLPKEEFYGKNDRVISIEMFEHMKNYELLLEKVSNWLKPDGKVNTQIQIQKIRVYVVIDLHLALHDTTE